MVWKELHARNIDSRNSQAAAIATIAIETASTFHPIHEYGTPRDWAGYGGGPNYAGRGYIQLTHDYNYESVGQRIGVDLRANPDLALDPGTAARIFADYWDSHDIAAFADSGQWITVRRAVVGYVTNPPGYPRLLTIVENLGA